MGQFGEPKRQICCSIPLSLYNELKDEAEKLGIPLSHVVLLRLGGYEIKKKEER